MKNLVYVTQATYGYEIIATDEDETLAEIENLTKIVKLFARIFRLSLTTDMYREDFDSDYNLREYRFTYLFHFSVEHDGSVAVNLFATLELFAKLYALKERDKETETIK